MEYFTKGANAKSQGRRRSICPRKGYREEETQQHLVSKCANVKNSQSQLARVMGKNKQEKIVCQKKKVSGFVSKQRTVILTENFLYYTQGSKKNFGFNRQQNG